MAANEVGEAVPRCHLSYEDETNGGFPPKEARRDEKDDRIEKGPTERFVGVAGAGDGLHELHLSFRALILPSQTRVSEA
eukprot:CAMPEP_0185798576 /NCGR_PEP_ID=MMETSP1174-20130828/162222_1 /TAXON_ID=35687 /ORGANISM="Dictyocha speculum, Strain CCMP1381" /LENGTH=78 /DNA_ID=CAMNT_0028494081 /DNA_START=462 /DNA_END=698 /DNA_ORIENTATION=-